MRWVAVDWYLGTPTLKSPNDSVLVSIGGLSIALYCDDVQTQELLRSRYRPWQDTGQVLGSAVVRCGTGSPIRERPTPVASFLRDQSCQIKAPGYLGMISSDGLRAHLDLDVPSVTDVDYFLRAVFTILAYQHGGLLIHAAGLLRTGNAFLFSGRSGVGKSTTVRVSHGLPATSALGDDLILLLPQGDGWRAWGTPFWNPETPPARRTAQAKSGPLAAIFRLAQDSRVFIRLLSPAHAVAGLMSDIPVTPLDGRRVPVLLERLFALVKMVPIGELHFRPEPSFWSKIDVFLQGPNPE